MTSKTTKCATKEKAWLTKVQCLNRSCNDSSRIPPSLTRITLMPLQVPCPLTRILTYFMQKWSTEGPAPRMARISGHVEGRRQHYLCASEFLSSMSSLVTPTIKTSQTPGSWRIRDEGSYNTKHVSQSSRTNSLKLSISRLLDTVIYSSISTQQCLVEDYQDRKAATLTCRHIKTL